MSLNTTELMSVIDLIQKYLIENDTNVKEFSIFDFTLQPLFVTTSRDVWPWRHVKCFGGCYYYAIFRLLSLFNYCRLVI